MKTTNGITIRRYTPFDDVALSKPLSAPTDSLNRAIGIAIARYIQGGTAAVYDAKTGECISVDSFGLAGSFKQ